MPDGFAQIRIGETRPLYGQETMLTGSLTIQATPAPTASLFNAAGTAVAGFEEIPASGYDLGANSAPRVWLNLNASTIPAGYYTLAFTFSAVSSDGGTRRYRPTLEVHVREETD